jgi:putative hydrolase of the HAD superfamily
MTNLEGYFEQIISSHDYGFAKEEQAFWTKLEQSILLDKTKSIFFDDSLSVLNAAQKFGVGTVVAINKPSSKIAIKSIEGFLNIENFKDILT